MVDQGFSYDPNAFRTRPTTGRWWPKIVASFAVCGGVYGAAIGATISTTDGAAATIGIAAGVMALICGSLGTRFSFFFAILNRARFARLVFGLLAAMAGVIFGGVLGLMAIMPFGAIPGAVGGWLIARVIFRRSLFTRLMGQLLGFAFGLCVGATILALSETPAAALVGIACGVGIGAVVAPVPLLLFGKLMDSLVPKRYTKGPVIDTTVVDGRERGAEDAPMLNHEAYDVGYDAYWDGVDESDNPFKEYEEPENRRAWDEGWRKARVDDHDERE